MAAWRLAIALSILDRNYLPPGGSLGRGKALWSDERRIRRQSVHAKLGRRATSGDESANASADFSNTRQCGEGALRSAPPGSVGIELRIEAAARNAGRDPSRRPHTAAGRHGAGPCGGDDALQLRFCVAASERRRYRHRRGLSAWRMGHSGPHAVSLSLLRQSRPHSGDAWQQAADALRPDRAALV